MATETTLTSAKAWSPDITTVAPSDAIPNALVLLTSTVAGSIEGDEPAVRAQYIDDAAATFVAEGAAIPEADPDLAEVLVHTGKVSQLIRLSREQWRQPNASTLLSESVRRAVTRAANAAYIAQVHPGSTTQTVTITGSPSGGNFTLSGNGATTGTIAFDAASATVQTAVRTLGVGFSAATVTGSAGGPYTVTVAAAAGTLAPNPAGLTGGTSPGVTVTPTGTAVTPPAGLTQVGGILGSTSPIAVASDLDVLVDLQASIAANDGNPSHILLSPLAWASLRKLKDEADSARSLLGAGTEDAIPSLLNLPVIVDNAVPAGTGLMIDRRAIISAVGQVQVAQSEHVYFGSDSIGLRCTWRFGANVVRPERIAKFSVTAPA